MVVPLEAARFCQKVGGGTTLCCRLQPEHDGIVVGRPAWWLTAALVTCWRAWLDCPDALMTWRGRPWRLRRSKCRARVSAEVVRAFVYARCGRRNLAALVPVRVCGVGRWTPGRCGGRSRDIAAEVAARGAAADGHGLGIELLMWCVTKSRWQPRIVDDLGGARSGEEGAVVAVVAFGFARYAGLVVARARRVRVPMAVLAE